MHTGHSGRSRRDAGFTLVEVLVTLMIMAGIMVSVTQILTASRNSRDEIHNIQERLLVGPAILQRLERDLRALLVYDRDPRHALRVRDRVLSGFDADTIDFVCTVDSLMPYREASHEPFRRADVNEVGYRLRPHPEFDDFLELYRREDFGVDEEPFDGGRFALLHDRIKGFNVEVFDEDGPDAEPLEGWDEEGEYVGLPTRLVVELTIELAPRLVREQLIRDRRTITYRRVFRFSEMLRHSTRVQAVPKIPVIEPPTAEGPAAAGGGDIETRAGGEPRRGREGDERSNESRGGNQELEDDEFNPFTDQ